jgi:hypothetical protein
LFLLFLLFSTEAVGGWAAQKPPESAPQPKECVTVNVASPQADSKTSTQEVLEVAHTAVDNAVTYIHYVSFVAAGLTIILIVAGGANLLFPRYLGNRMRSIQEQYQNLEQAKNAIMEDVAELKNQEISLRKLAETVQAATLAASHLGAESRLRALQKLSQQLDPLGITPLLEVLMDSTNVLKLRLEAAYGLGRYSENPAFKEYYPEIFSGFCEVLKNLKTERGLVSATIDSVRRYENIPDELASLLKKRDKRKQ